MGEFNDAVSTLLEACSNGVAAIRRLRRRRKKIKLEIDPDAKIEESRLNRSLKRTILDVQTVYAAALRKLGNRFAKGDIKAKSSLKSIMRRLKSGFAGVVNRLTKGESTRTDYQRLSNLSDVSRVEVLDTFKRLSTRLSQDSAMRRKTHDSPRPQGVILLSTSGSHRAINSSQLPLKGALGKDRSKPSGKQTSPRRQSIQGLIPPKGVKGEKREGADRKPRLQRPNMSIRPKSQPLKKTPALAVEPQKNDTSSSPLLHSRPIDRMSVISFASDSTKLGEIPHCNINIRTDLSPNEEQCIGSTLFPVTPWKRPEKARSRFIRLFRN